MRKVFVDTFYWIARINPRDQWHQKAVELSASLDDAELITSETVLVELLNYFSEYGPEMRGAVARIVRQIIDGSGITVVLDAYGFAEGLALFGARLDKGYSMTDCMSMNIMRRVGATEVLTHDRHFAQEGFIILL
ncbi:MAG TPA: PIN domain-containing protein [Pyrinomonadaceae bacterium]|nr:PIN domain-containing protein [Pyrinomonadaceae bacterium]